MGALSWLSELAQWFGKWVPRLVLIRATEGAVKFLPGGKTKEYGPGLLLYWPLTTEIQQYPVVRQVLRLSPQTLMTEDGVSVVAAGILTYTVTDLHTFLVENFDAEHSLDDISQTAIRSAIVTHDFEEIQNDRKNWDRTLTLAGRSALRQFGVKVEALRITTFAKARVLNLIGPGLFGPSPNTFNPVQEIPA